VLGLVVLAGALVVFSTTELTGAREVRGLISAAVHLVRKEAVQHIPELREKTRQAVNNAAGILGGTGGKAGTTAECPPGTRRVTSFPVHGRDETAGSGEHGPTGPVCVDEHLVSEDDYAGCVSCERPGPSSPRAKGKTRGHSEFCLKDRSPTSNPIRCVTWKQADAYCQAHTGRLPTEDELRAVTPAATKATEWTQATPRAGRERWGSFRCVRSL
jgi:hypothetical protein